MAIDTIKAQAIFDGTVGTDDLADGSIATAKLANSAVTTAKLNNGSVTTDKITDGNVTTAKIADGEVTSAKLDTGVAVANLGYTPVDNSGDTMTGSLVIDSAQGASSGSALTVTGPGTYDGVIRVINESDPSGGQGFMLATDSNWSIGDNKFVIGYGEPSSLRVAVAIDSNYQVNMPAQPSFYANSTPTKAGNGDLSNFGNVRYNIGSHYNNSTGNFTCPVDGRYLIMAGVRVSNYAQLFAVINGTFDDIGAEADAAGGTGDSANFAAVYQLDANDTINLRMTSGTLVASTPRMYFSVHLLS